MLRPSLEKTPSASASQGEPPQCASLEEQIELAAGFLPAQGPIRVFIHHNTLHAFEDLTFDEGVVRGGRMFDCQPYLSEARYRELFANGRIREQDLSAVLLDDLGDRGDDLLGFMGTRFHFRLAMLKYPLQMAPAGELRWFIAETDALTKYRADAPARLRQRCLRETCHWVLRDLLDGTRSGKTPDAETVRINALLADLLDHFGRDSVENWSEATWEAFSLRALWRVCREGVHRVKLQLAEPSPPLRHRDALLEVTGQDSDVLVHDVLIPFCASFLDQGQSRWPLPHRELGFFGCFAKLFAKRSRFCHQWTQSLPAELDRIAAAGMTPLESIEESLRLLGVTPEEQEDYLRATLLALRGWAGMIRQMEVRADRVANPVKPGSLVEFLAVRLILDRLAIEWLIKEEWHSSVNLAEARRAAQATTHKHDAVEIDQLAFVVFQLSQALGWLPAELRALSQREWATLVRELEDFPSLERRRLFHAAFERYYRIQTLDALSAHPPQYPEGDSTPAFQLITCLDEREESFRRHIEELAPRAETFGAAGFYNVPMYYRGAADANFVPLSPIIVVPQHWVVEDVVISKEATNDRRMKARRAVGMASHRIHVGSRDLTFGALVAAGLGTLASIPMVMRVLFPRLTARIRRTANRLVQPPEQTCLRLERIEERPGTAEGEIGFSVDEMADMVERLLQDIGLTRTFAKFVLVIGHGSNSLNNPHNSAYNCGACGGGAGGPNARAFAQMANDPRVRNRLAARGIPIPDSTVFIGALHNTCDDSVRFFDVDRLNFAHARAFVAVREIIEAACDRNAHERCRRFISAPLDMTFRAARRHVEARSEDLAQVRPECGHATNAVCFVGRRSRTRGLFLDRRTFLTSYDPATDDENHSILHRVLKAAVPVCAGINLEYYFSYVDPVGWGCSTKLPHNVTSLLGVMDGAASDLRPGLPWQMVEIHEPVRLLFVIETSPTAMEAIMDRDPAIARLCRHEWVQLATLDPNSNRIHLLQRGKFEVYHPETQELPRVRSSVDWYRGWRDHLGYAEIQPV